MDIFKKLKKRKTAFISLIILGILVFLALVGNTILGIDPFETNSKIRLLAPGMGHILGTDNLGRDVLARVIYGIRISLAISLVSVAFALICRNGHRYNFRLCRRKSGFCSCSDY